MTTRGRAAATPEQLGRVQRALTARFLSESIVAEVTHFLLLLVALGMLWKNAPVSLFAVWVAIVGATSARVILRAMLARRVEPIERVPLSLRASIVAVGLAWGAGALCMAPLVPLADLALLMVLLAGLAASATSTLVADAPAFYGFLIAMLSPLGIGILVAGHDRPHIAAVLLIATFGAVTTVIYRRANATLLAYLLTSDTLELKRVEALEERRRAEQRFAARDTVGHILAESTLDQPILPGILRALVEQLSWDAAIMWRLDPVTRELRAQDIWCSERVESFEFVGRTRATVRRFGSG
ncbi:MAG TPA: hypothetical protein VMH39_09525, partial [Gemmatimonadaceae bacterium]|nr:hypothetical protein [Gemmatimonadaceae bacterium]